MDFLKRLKKIREKHKNSIEYFATILGLTKERLLSFENQEDLPTEDELLNICRVLYDEYIWILTGDSDNKFNFDNKNKRNRGILQTPNKQQKSVLDNNIKWILVQMDYFGHFSLRKISFGFRIKKIRKLEKYTQKQLAELLNIDVTSIQNYENFRREPNAETLHMLCQKFPEYTLWLMTGKTEPPHQIDPYMKVAENRDNVDKSQSA